MTNGEIAELTANDYVGRGNSYYPTVYDAVMTALQLKDTQVLSVMGLNQPITQEILENNGFVKRSDRDNKLGMMEYYHLEDYGFVYHYSDGDWEFRLQNTQEHRLFSGYLNNVNELQHVLNILNIEKEIKL